LPTVVGGVGGVALTQIRHSFLAIYLTSGVEHLESLKHN